MSKKTKRSKQPPQRLVPPQLLEQQIRHAQYQMLQGNFAEAITTCEPLLGYLPKRSSLRVEVLALLGLAYGMLQHRFFLNPHRDERFTTCPRCILKTRPRKFTLVIHVDPIYQLTLDKKCRYCYHCDLVIAHQDQIEEQLVAHLTTFNPVIIGNDYLVIGTLNWTEWKHEKGQLSTQEMIEHLHDFKEVVTFKPNYV